jgi:hypothetical protein
MKTKGRVLLLNITEYTRQSGGCLRPQGADSLPPPLRVAKTGKNHLNEEITSLLHTGIGERFIQTISHLGNAALLRRCELPYKRKC